MPMRNSRSEAPRPGASAFTLLELAVVLALLGSILLVAVPRLSIFEETAFRSDARRVAAVIRQLDDSAAAGKTFYTLSFTLGSNSLELSKSGDKGSSAPDEGLPGRVRLGRTTNIASFSVGAVTKESGPASIVFAPSGAQPFSISLESGGRRCTITYNPYSGKVKIT